MVGRLVPCPCQPRLCRPIQLRRPRLQKAQERLRQLTEAGQRMAGSGAGMTLPFNQMLGIALYFWWAERMPS